MHFLGEHKEEENEELKGKMKITDTVYMKAIYGIQQTVVGGLAQSLELGRNKLCLSKAKKCGERHRPHHLHDHFLGLPVDKNMILF